MLDLGLIELLLTLTAVALAFYYYSTATHDYWVKRNVPGPKPLPLFGNFKDVILFRTSAAEKLRDLYLHYKNEPLIGIFEGNTPILYVRDPEILRHILIKDFSVFTDRGININEKADPLSAHLLTLEGHRWRGLRNNLSPAFTSGKVRLMFNLLSECADQFEKYIEELITKGEPIECRELTSKFTTDVIGSCAFGINMNAMSKNDSEFRRMGRKYIEPSLRGILTRIVARFFPNLFRFLQLRTVTKEMTDFFVGSIKETIEFRQKHNINRHDFVDLLMRIKANPDKTDFELTDNLIAAQAFVFFLAGCETSSTTISFALYELAHAQDIQEKVRAEIQKTLEKHDGELNSEVVKEMRYLDMVLRETMRKNPPIPLLIRQAGSEYTIPGTNVHLPSGQKVMVPVLGLHNNPEYYPNPEVFDPERFSEEACKDRHPMTYLPFGEGPRNCIGSRFADLQTKMGIITVLKNYRITLSEGMKVPYVINKGAFILTADGGINLNFTKIRNMEQILKASQPVPAGVFSLGSL